MQIKCLLAALANPAFVLSAVVPQYGNSDAPFQDESFHIVGGVPAAPGDFPYVVSLRRSGRHFCGGSLLNGNTILTAAHCVDDVSPSAVIVRAGSLNRESGGVLLQVSDIKVFPSNNATTYDGDIAIVKLATAIPANITIAYAVLPASGSDPAADLTTSTVGWGKLLENATTLPTELFKVDIPVVDREDCATALAQINDVTETMFCAGLIDGGKDTCQGDSGGPITDCATKVLLGTVSWGRGCARPELPGVYSNIGEESLNNWIVENL